MVDHSLIGKSATVTGKVGPGMVGEVAVHIRGGSESYFARLADGTEVIEKGQQVVIVNAAAGRTVYVSAFGAL